MKGSAPSTPVWKALADGHQRVSINPCPEENENRSITTKSGRENRLGRQDSNCSSCSSPLNCACMLPSRSLTRQNCEADLVRQSDQLPEASISTRFELAEIPCGNRTFQRRSFWSTWRIRLASAGAWSTAASMSRKSGPICRTGIEKPLTSRRIVTRAECPP